tara:strand:+ start:3722 stop:4201 length:480 start_codon:yes stop_codon:yes gene_type:complete
MIDPISAVAMATAAFNTINKMVSAGKEIEETLGQVGKWYGAVSDFNEAKKQAENPPLFKKLFTGASVEEEAMNVYIQEKKIKHQEAELRTLLQWTYGPSGYQELIDMRRKIRDQREKTIYARDRKRKELFWTTINCVGIVVLGYGCYLVGMIIRANWPA